jgi:hypothetical protein
VPADVLGAAALAAICVAVFASLVASDAQLTAALTHNTRES